MRNKKKQINSPFYGKKILILEGYCKQCLPFIRGFRELGCEVTILCSSRLDCGYASRLPHHKILGVCDLKKPEESEKYIVELIKKSNFDLVFPVFDFSARILSKNKEELSKYSIIYANDKETFDLANDKNEVMRVCMDNGIPCPKTYFNISKITDISNNGMTFPLIIKPRRMYGARGFHIFRTFQELEDYCSNNSIDLSQYVVQEYIPEKSKLGGVNIFIDRNGIIRSSYTYICEHIYPESGGTSTLNGIAIREDIQKDCEKLVRLMNLRGVVGVDIMIDSRNNIGKVIEINVRPVHAISIGFFFGVDYAQQVLEDAFGLLVTNMSINRTDTAVRIFQTDILWFFSSKNRYKQSPRRLGYKHVKEQMFFWSDPLPWFAFLLDGVKNYKKKMLEKTK